MERLSTLTMVTSCMLVLSVASILLRLPVLATLFALVGTGTAVAEVTNSSIGGIIVPPPTPTPTPVNPVNPTVFNPTNVRSRVQLQTYPTPQPGPNHNSTTFLPPLS